MPTQIFTRTDSAANEWAIDDDVVRLRQWGTDIVHALSDPPDDGYTLGAAENCSLRLDDPSGRVSRLHARLVRDEGNWLLRDAGSKNGLRGDGARRTEIVLQPGLEIGIGGLTLIAESALSMALRGFLSRLLGWGSERVEAVDHAIRSIRMAAARRAALFVCGEGDLVRTARSIHRHSKGAHRPFIVCDPRRQTGKATVRAAENYATGMEALAAAAGGTVCVRRQRLPADFRELADALRTPSSQVQLVVCTETLDDGERYSVTPIVIPRLTSREDEIDQIINDYAADAIAELGTSSEFLAADRAWVREHACTTLPEIETATLRLVALRASRNLAHAAARLGMAPVSLSRWIGRRRLPMEIVE